MTFVGHNATACSEEVRGQGKSRAGKGERARYGKEVPTTMEDPESRAMAVERDGAPMVVRVVPGALARAAIPGKRVVNIASGGKTKGARRLSR